MKNLSLIAIGLFFYSTAFSQTKTAQKKSEEPHCFYCCPVPFCEDCSDKFKICIKDKSNLILDGGYYCPQCYKQSEMPIQCPDCKKDMQKIDCKKKKKEKK